MTFKIKSIEDIADSKIDSVGGKSKALASLYESGANIPFTCCIPTDFYFEFINSEKLAEKISFELGRKDISDMRWEEIWDCSLRIRNLFLKQKMPEVIELPIRKFIEVNFKDKKTAIRSSAPSEDSKNASFAGLHESYINISGVKDIIKHIKLVWASLWSDSAILYRKELGLDIVKSSMAVVVQEVVEAAVSGIAFSKNPQDEASAVIEGIFGLNQGLVDGLIEPDRWVITRQTGSIEKEHIAPKEFRFILSESGLDKAPIPDSDKHKPVLKKDQVKEVFNEVMQSETYFASPQDMEWSYEDNNLFILQSRPITTINENPEDNRNWYRSLTRSFENLAILRKRIENELIPKMISEAESIPHGLEEMTNIQLIEEINQRKRVLEKWRKIYWDEFIPFAHGIRIFGEFYNDRISPEDPYEFVNLLQGRDLLCLERNSLLNRMVALAKEDPSIFQSIERGILPYKNAELKEIVEQFKRDSGSVEEGQEDYEKVNDSILCNAILELAKDNSTEIQRIDHKELEGKYFSFFRDDEKKNAEDFLSLGRSSYKLRDDDNIYLGRIEENLSKVLTNANDRIKNGKGNRQLEEASKITLYEKPIHTTPSSISLPSEVSDRQITGQPSSPGLATGKARVILKKSDLKEFVKGEILVCDAIDPTMTFIVPLAAGIVERRGGMLIHGAIIAREYGIGCVTGIPNAVDRIRTGDKITIDGYLGIVTLGDTEECFTDN